MLIRIIIAITTLMLCMINLQGTGPIRRVGSEKIKFKIDLALLTFHAIYLNKVHNQYWFHLNHFISTENAIVHKISFCQKWVGPRTK